jgi:hypothetical protein
MSWSWNESMVTYEWRGNRSEDWLQGSYTRPCVPRPPVSLRRQGVAWDVESAGRNVSQASKTKSG